MMIIHCCSNIHFHHNNILQWIILWVLAVQQLRKMIALFSHKSIVMSNFSNIMYCVRRFVCQKDEILTSIIRFIFTKFLQHSVDLLVAIFVYNEFFFAVSSIQILF